MSGNYPVHVLTLPTAFPPSLISLPGNSSNGIPYLPSRSRTRFNRIRAMSADAGPGETSSAPEVKNALSVVLDLPRSVWRKTLRPLSDFGFGRRSIWDGGVGLLLISGTVLLALTLAWLRAFQMQSKFRKYTAVFEFAQACGICTGTPVRIRGATVGNVTRVNPSLKCIEAIVEVSFNANLINL